MSRKKLGITLVILFILYCVTVFAFFMDSDLDAEVEVLDQSDPRNLGKVTQLKVKVTNNEDFSFKPVFTSLDDLQRRHSLYTRLNGSKIHSGETEVFQIRLKSEKDAIDSGQEFMVAVNPENRTMLAFSEKQVADIN